MKRLGLGLVFGAVATFGLGCDDATDGAGGSTGASMTTGATSTSATLSSSSTGVAANPCPGSGAEITELPTCGTMAASPVPVAAGCDPTFDGTLHADEWTDAACFLAGDMSIRAKYGADGLYLAASGPPTCGCPMGFVFDPDHAGDANGDEYIVALFDDPFDKDGDRGDFLLMNGTFMSGMGPEGIVTACPGNMPNPVRYEIKLPYAAIGAPDGAPHDLGFAFYHANEHWPPTLVLDAMNAPTDPKSYGVLSLK